MAAARRARDRERLGGGTDPSYLWGATSLHARARSQAPGSVRPLEFLTLEADPFAVVVLAGAESGRHHGHTAGCADRRTVVSIHA